jgi:hypothetical protein
MEGTESAVNSAPASTGPTTFAEAFAADASPASGSPEQTTTPAAAEQPTAAQETTPAGDDRSPFIPRARFDEVNTKYGELKSWKEQYGWAEQVNRDAVEKFASIAQRYQGDPVGLLQELAAEVQAHPEHGAKLRTFAAQQLAAARRQQAPEAPAVNLDAIEIDLGNGQSVPLSALKTQWMAEVEQRFQPVVKSVEQANQERAQQASEHFATTTVGELTKQLPDFGTHAKEIGQRLQALKLNTDDPAMLKLAVKAIYADLVTPQRQQLASKAQSQLLDNLQHKAAASTSVNPGSAAPSTPRQVTSFTDPSLKWD